MGVGESDSFPEDTLEHRAGAPVTMPVGKGERALNNWRFSALNRLGYQYDFSVKKSEVRDYIIGCESRGEEVMIGYGAYVDDGTFSDRCKFYPNRRAFFIKTKV